MLPTFIGIGAPKAGTTWIFRCLEEHPEVFMAAVKETNFFDYETIDGRWAEYEAHFVGAERFNAVGEVSVRYLASPHAPERIHRLLPSVRLFVCLRNPVDQVYSHYWHLSRQNFHQWDIARVPDSFEEAIETFDDKIIRPCLYAGHLERWHQRFDDSQILVLLYDDIVSGPESSVQELYRFIGVSDRFVPKSIHEKGWTVRRGASPRSPLLRRVHSSLYDYLNRKVYSPLKRLLGARTAIWLKDAFRVRGVLEGIFFRPGYPAMRPATRSYLRSRFHDEISRLEAMLGRSLGMWK